MSRRWSFLLGCFAPFVLLASSLQASLIGAGTPIPASEVIINFAGTGLDWVYAGPVAPGEFGVGEIEPASFRAGEGWRTATASEWAAKPAPLDFAKPGFAGVPGSIDGWTDHSTYKFTSEYWSSFLHVDIDDALAGRITDGVNGLVSGVPETWYVRNTQNPNQNNGVPEPATATIWALGALGCALAAYRRRKQAE